MINRFVVLIRGSRGEIDFRLYKDWYKAQNRYFRAFAVVAEKQFVKTVDGGLAQLDGCSLYEVGTKNRIRAQKMISQNQARRIRDSEDVGVGAPIEIANLFRKYH